MEKYRESDIPVRPQPLSPPPPKGGKSPANPHLSSLCAAVGFGADAIESNIAGFQKKTVPAGKYQMFGVQFDKDGKAMTADQAFKVDSDVAAWVDPEMDDDCIPDWYKDAVCLKVPIGTVDKGYSDYYYSINACDEDDDYKGKPGWANEYGMLQKNVQLKPGYGVWIVAGKEDVEITIAGCVKEASSDSFSGGVGYNLLRLPFPVTINAGDASIDWGFGASAPASWVDPEMDDDCIPDWYKDAPCIKIPIGTVDKGYVDLYYSSNACDEDDDYKGKPGWANEYGMLQKNVTIPAGVGFWLVAPKAFTATQNNPTVK